MNQTRLVDDSTAGFVAVAMLSDIPEGWVLKTRIGGVEIALANSNGTIHALDNSCTHAGGPLGDNRLKEGCFVECPWHNSVFDVRNGEPVGGPSRKAVRKFHVRVDDGVVYVSVADVAKAEEEGIPD
jgi:3-phenylpropionate/trans-cinnamate dioxygenase ferredoxin component